MKSYATIMQSSLILRSMHFPRFLTLQIYLFYFRSRRPLFRRTCDAAAAGRTHEICRLRQLQERHAEKVIFQGKLECFVA